MRSSVRLLPVLAAPRLGGDRSERGGSLDAEDEGQGGVREETGNIKYICICKGNCFKKIYFSLQDPSDSADFCPDMSVRQTMLFHAFLREPGTHARSRDTKGRVGAYA